MRLMAAGLMVCLSPSAMADDRSAYGHDLQVTRYSPLTQITPENVSQLKPAWTFHTGNIADGKHGSKRSGFETTPLFLEGRHYLTTPFNRVIALNPASGNQLWAYDPQIDKKQAYGDGLINRGLAAWRDPRATNCKLRLFEAPWMQGSWR
jgi:quinoprotein glucose dehydrogenase